jgi:hypothetical protein
VDGLRLGVLLQSGPRRLDVRSKAGFCSLVYHSASVVPRGLYKKIMQVFNSCVHASAYSKSSCRAFGWPSATKQILGQ